MLIEQIQQKLFNGMYFPMADSIDALQYAGAHLEEAHQIAVQTLATGNEQARQIVDSYAEAVQRVNDAGLAITEALHKLNVVLAKLGVPPFEMGAFQPATITSSQEHTYDPGALSRIDVVYSSSNIGPVPLKEMMHKDEVAAAWRARVNFVAAVRRRGGGFAEDPSGDTPSFTGDDRQRLVIRADGPISTNPRLDNIQELVPGLAKPWEEPYLKFCETEDITPRLPYMLVTQAKDAGEGKYLIETVEQHEQAKSYIASISKYGLGVKDIVAKQFIETPSDHYTSYRLLVTASGRIVGAGLLYSDHPKYQDRTVDRGDYGLANPGSPHYIAARDVRSNLSLGGHVIPLMGDNPQPVSEYEKGILTDHNIDAANPDIPQELRDKATAIARAFGSRVDVYAGLDFIQSASGEFYFLESNTSPGSKTYTACHNAGQQKSYVEIYDGIFNQLLADLEQES